MTEDLTQYDRRKTVDRGDYTLSYSIPAGVTDEAAAAEVDKMERAIARGYSYKLNFYDDGPLWREWLFRSSAKLGAWFKYRFLDVYWFVKDRL